MKICNQNGVICIHAFVFQDKDGFWYAEYGSKQEEPWILATGFSEKEAKEHFVSQVAGTVALNFLKHPDRAPETMKKYLGIDVDGREVISFTFYKLCENALYSANIKDEMKKKEYRSLE